MIAGVHTRCLSYSLTSASLPLSARLLGDFLGRIIELPAVVWISSP
jgi:hypothetical protein